ncbi:MAG: HAD family phosphatase [Nitrospirota bacterium]|nr:HAD family phosphatase [Nitrospirota bacterium]
MSDILVLFDFNGVIADDESVHQMLLQKVLAEEGITITDQQYHDVYLGFDDKGAFEHACRANGRTLDEADMADLVARKSHLYDAYIVDHLVLFPGAVDSVKTMAGEFSTGIVSGALKAEIGRICDIAGVVECLSFVVSSEDTEHCKPHPEGYLVALALYNLTVACEGKRIGPESCVVIEDSIAGVEAAKAAGMHCVAITHSYQAHELTQADRVIGHMDEFTPELVRELVGGRSPRR